MTSNTPRRIAIAIGFVAVAIAVKACATKCLRMLHEGRGKRELVARLHEQAWLSGRQAADARLAA